MANKIFEFVGVSKKGTERSNFDLNHENKATFNYGEIVPTLATQLVPGDSGRIRTEHVLRQQTMLAPVMQRSNVSHHFFKVPPRLVDRNFLNKRMRWNPRSNESWDCLATHTRLSEIAKLGLDELGISNKYWSPTSDVANPEEFSTDASCLSQTGSLLDYMGLPCGPHFEYKLVQESSTGPYAWRWINSTPEEYYDSLRLINYDSDADNVVKGGDEIINLYPFLCYQLVYMTFYRAQDYETDWLHEILELIQPISDAGRCVTIDNIGRENFAKLFTLRHRGYSKDYFTSALPHALKSTEWPDGVRVPTNDNASAPNSFSIEMLRLANSVQQWLERDARGGTRYPEWTLSHYGVHSSNALLDLPEFVGGVSAPLSVSDVDQTAPLNGDYVGEYSPATSGESPLGTTAGKSVNYDSSGYINFYSEEDSYIFCLTSVMPKQGYSQGIRKELIRTDFLDDYYMPEFANLGEQPVKSKELIHYAAGINRDSGDFEYSQDNPYFDLSVINSRTIGYQSRYADWKFLPDEIHGEFRNSLNYWHMSRIFPYLNREIPYNGLVINSLINIGKDFIACHPEDVDRVFALQSQVSSQLKLQIFFDFSMRRPMPEFPIPSL